MRVILYSLLVCTLLILLSSCRRDYFDNNSEVVVGTSVELRGLPPPENKIELLKRNAPQKPVDLSGVWSGSVRLVVSGKIIQRPLKLSFNRNDEGWGIKYIGLGGVELPVENFSYNPPIMTYQVKSYMMNADGEAMPFLAELVVSQDTIRGLYRQIAEHYGDEVLYFEYDANFSRD